MAIRNYVKEVVSMDIYKINHRLSAATTVEACFVIPLYMYAALTLIYILQSINVRCDIDEATYNALKYQTGMASLSGAVTSASIYVSLLNNLGYDYASTHNIVGGNAGIVVMTDISDDSSTIHVDITYHIKNPFDIFGIGILTEKREYTVEAWLGEDKSKEWESNFSIDGEVVYITENSEVFHRKRQCSSLVVTVIEVSMGEVNAARNENGGKYHECSSCKKYGYGNIVYITPFGNEYHAHNNCSALKRTVLQVPIDSVKDKRECLLCGK